MSDQTVYISVVKTMINIRAEKEFIDMFDKVAAIHNRDRTKELRQLMIEDIRKEFPDYQPPQSY